MSAYTQEQNFDYSSALSTEVNTKVRPEEAGLGGWSVHKNSHITSSIITSSPEILKFLQYLKDYDSLEVTPTFRKNGKDKDLESKINLNIQSIVTSFKQIKKPQLKDYCVEQLFKFIFYKRDIRRVGAKQRFLSYKLFVNMINDYTIDIIPKMLPLFSHYGCFVDLPNILKMVKIKKVRLDIINFIGLVLKQDLLKVVKSGICVLNPDFVIGLENNQPMFLNKTILPNLKLLRTSVKKSSESQIKLTLISKWTSEKHFDNKKFCKFILKKIFNIAESDNEDFSRCYLKVYRFVGTILRQTLKIFETPMCEKDFDSINVSKIPAGAVSKYRYFLQNESTRFKNRPSINPSHIALTERMMKALDKGVINATVNDLYSLSKKFEEKISASHCGLSKGEITSLTYEFYQKLEQLKTTLGGLEVTNRNFMFCCDISGSMQMARVQGIACVLTMLGALLSDMRGKNGFPMFSTFEEKPTIHEIDIETGGPIKCYQQIMQSRVGYTTDVVAQVKVMIKCLLDYNRVNPSKKITQMPNMVFVTDAYFNQQHRHTGSYNNDTMMEFVEKLVSSNGLTMGSVVFWNLNGTSTVSTVKNDCPGIIEIQGSAEAIVLQVFTSKYINPLDHFMNTINQEHFDIISHMLHFRGNDYWDEMNRYLSGDLKVSGKVSSQEESGSSKQSEASSHEVASSKQSMESRNDEVASLKKRIKDLEELADLKAREAELIAQLKK